MSRRALPPSSRSRAWASSVLPAPVSPVSMFRPGARRSSARSISSRFSTRSSCSTSPVYQARRTEIPRVGGRLRGRGHAPELRAQGVVEGGAGPLRQRPLVVDEAGLDALAGLEHPDGTPVDGDLHRLLLGAVV